MIPIKTEEEIKIMKEGGRRLAWVFGQVLKKIRPGVKLSQLDKLAEELIKKQGGFPSFKTVKGYNWATCINVGSGVVHGIPGDYQIKEGDLLSLDMGMLYGGFHTDMARTFWVRSQKSKFLKIGERALRMAIKAARLGNRVGHISEAIEKEIKKAGFSPIEALTGHGVGQKLHEEPQIPCFVKGKINQTPLLKPGMTLAIEVIYAEGKPDLVLENDGWTVKTADSSLAGLFEDTILVTKKSPIILTPLETKLEVC
ncbi:MAG: type I methionyl aminopeptidase [Microgenomates group bacterium]